MWANPTYSVKPCPSGAEPSKLGRVGGYKTLSLTLSPAGPGCPFFPSTPFLPSTPGGPRSPFKDIKRKDSYCLIT